MSYPKLAKAKLFFLVLVLGSFLLSSSPVEGKKGEFTFDYGVQRLPIDIDPHYAWDSDSMDFIDQICEGLFGYNLTDPDMAIIPVLASTMGTWNAEATEYTVPLKHNVTFHDGTVFDAYDVKWSFDRLTWLINNRSSQLTQLYQPLDGELLLQETEVIDPFTVRYILNYPYLPLVPLLCFSGSVILSESSTPATEYLEIESDLLVGTGPYMHTVQDNCSIQLNSFSAWHGDRPDNYIQEINWIHVEDATAKNQDFLDGGLDGVDGILPEFIEQFNASKYFEVDALQQGTAIFFLVMNNKEINQTMRQAMSWAFDYDYVIDELLSGNAARLISPVPEGIMYHKPDLEFPFFNITHARQILLNAGLLPVGAEAELENDTFWETLTEVDPIATYTYSWLEYYEFRANLGLLMQECMTRIGVAIELESLTWNDVYPPVPLFNWDFYDHIQLYFTGWGADYNDPSTYINELFSDTSNYNYAHVNDSLLQEMMMDGLTELNETARRDLYYAMQKYIVEDLMPVVFLYVRQWPIIRSVTVDGILCNPMTKLWFASMYWTGIDGPRDSFGIPGYIFIGILGVVVTAFAAIYKQRKIYLNIRCETI